MLAVGDNEYMVKPTNTAAISAGTHREWEDWVQLLDSAGARELNHKAIAELALESMPQEASQRQWWAQGVAVAFEQHAGLRVPGQTSDGDFHTSASRTVPGDKDAALKAWEELVGTAAEFDGVPVDGEPSTSSTEKWRYWRIRLADGTRVSVNISNKQPDKALVAMEHTKIDTAERADGWRAYWKGLLANL